MHYIMRLHFPGKDFASIKTPSRPARVEHQRIILRLFNYRLCDGDAKVELECKAQRIAMLSAQPVYILRELMQHMTQQRMVAPGYRFLQEMTGRVVAGERTRITQLLNKGMTPAIGKQLEMLLQADEGMYRISAPKHEPKDFSYKELRREVERRKFFQPLHEFAKHFLATAGISNESGKYYASPVKFYTAYKLQRMSPATARLYLLCFACHRFRQINDNLIEAFIHWVGEYEKQAKLMAAEAMQCAIAGAADNLQAAGQVLGLFVDASITGDTPFSVVKEKAFSLLEPERFPSVSAYMRNIAFDKIGYEWSHYTKLSPTFKRNLRQLFSDLEFAGRVEDAPLLEAIDFLQGILREGKSPRQIDPAIFPAGVIPKNLQRHLFTKAEGKGAKKLLEVGRYEFMVYRFLRNALEAGDVFVNNSNEFRRFEDDLISDGRWRDKGAVLREIGSPVLLAPIKETLAVLLESLEAKFKAVNQRIDDGLNKHIKVTGAADKRRWTLIYPSEDEPVNNRFYSQLPGVGIADLGDAFGKKGKLDLGHGSKPMGWTGQDAKGALAQNGIIAESARRTKP
ncbi:MAG: DUF4158 domain-containing protein, partial [Proteobacteria bacterium]|nr:DUF4158 domain-containing protein [Pseudomonadota bacterium]